MPELMRLLAATKTVQRALLLLQSTLTEQRSKEHLLRGLLDVLEYFTPACFVIGWMVRTLYWTCRTPWTGGMARNCLLRCFCLLLSLHASRDKKSEYLRSICVALMTWTSVHDALPGYAHVEEVNEASLSRLTSSCTRNPNMATATDVNDLFLTLSDVSTRPHDVTTQRVRESLVRTIQTNIDILLRGPADAVSFTPWTSAKLCRCTGSWNAEHMFPTKRTCTPEQLTTLMRHYADVCGKSDRPDDSVIAWLDTYARHEAPCASGSAPDYAGTVHDESITQRTPSQLTVREVLE
jgi:hypothetical protein